MLRVDCLLFYITFASCCCVVIGSSTTTRIALSCSRRCGFVSCFRSKCCWAAEFKNLQEYQRFLPQDSGLSLRERTRMKSQIIRTTSPSRNICLGLLGRSSVGAELELSCSGVPIRNGLQSDWRNNKRTHVVVRVDTSQGRHQLLKRKNKSMITLLRLWNDGDNNEIEGIGNRIRCCFPYLLPLLDGNSFGHYIYERIPILGFWNDLLLGPLVQWNNRLPYLGIGFFVLLTLGTRFNWDMDRSIRFNAQQAALIDLALVFPEIISSGFQEGDVPRSLAEPCFNFVWYAYNSVVLYSVLSNLQGKKPDGIPFLSESAEWMVGPF